MTGAKTLTIDLSRGPGGHRPAEVNPEELAARLREALPGVEVNIRNTGTWLPVAYMHLSLGLHTPMRVYDAELAKVDAVFDHYRPPRPTPPAKRRLSAVEINVQRARLKEIREGRPS